jgi:serine protease AprX
MAGTEHRSVRVRGGVRLLLTGALLGTGLAMVPASASTPLPDMASIAQVVGAPQAWAAGADGHGVDVAVLDTGVAPVPGLDAPNKLVYGPDLSFDSQSETPTATLDGYGHGTAMAGIIAGNDGTPDGYTGIAPKARIVSVKVGASNGAVDVSQMIAGIDWVTQHAHDPGLNIRVLNLSLGTSSTQSYLLDPLAHAAEVAWRHGIVVVVAVGNDRESTRLVASPAIDPFLLAVGAEDPQGTVSPSDDTVAPFSQRGLFRRADLVAPGTYVYGLLAPGSTLAQQNPGAVFGGRFLRGSGTSQAAAVVSGSVADLLSVRPHLTPDQVKAILAMTAQRIDTTSLLGYIGSGLVQLQRAILAPTPAFATQYYPRSSGTGSLELARGQTHLSLDGVALSGEQDIFGKPWSTAGISQAEENGTAWADGVFNGSTWSGSTWSGSTWSGSTWSGSTWSGATWSGATWSGSTWSGSTWSGSTWSGSTWSGSTWSGSTWSGNDWMGATWD